MKGAYPDPQDLFASFCDLGMNPDHLSYRTFAIPGAIVDAVVVDPAHVGRDFLARKDNYDLTNKALLDVVGERMIVDVIRKTNQPYGRGQLLRDLRDLKVIFKTRR